MLLISILFSFIHMRIYYETLLSNPADFIIRCKDLGQYLSEINDYSQPWISLPETIEVDKEPLLFIFLSTLINVWEYTKYSWMYLWSSIIYCLTLISGALVAKRVTKVMKNIITLIVILISWTGYLLNSGLDSLVTRQLMWNMFLIILIFYLLTLDISKKDLKKTAIWGLFLMWAYLSHRVLGIISYLLMLTLFSGDFVKNKKLFQSNFFQIIMCSLIIGGGYFYMWADDIMITISNYSQKIFWWLNYTDASSLDKNLGISLFTWAGTTFNLPILEFFSFEWYLLIWLIGLWWFNFHKKYKILIIGFVLTGIYISNNIAFSVRMQLTFEVLTIIILSVGIMLNKKYKLFIILFSMLIFLLNFINISKRTLTWEVWLTNRVKNISADPSVNYLKMNIPLKKTFIFGTHCANEFGTQLWYKTPINFSNLTIWKEREKIDNGELPWWVYSGMSKAMRKNIFTNPYLYKKFEWYELYLIEGKYFGANDFSRLVQDIRQGGSKYLNQKHIKLIYDSWREDTYIRYIFKIYSDEIKYFDARNYFSKTLIDE